MTTIRKAFISAMVKSLLRGKSLLQAILAYWISPLLTTGKEKHEAGKRSLRSLQDFLKDAEALILGPVNREGLLLLSAGLKEQYRRRLQDDPQCMLPSYSHQLPHGNECGRYLALDVGGSTLRVAVVELNGRASGSSEHSQIVSMQNFGIGKSVKDLQGNAFFDWVAAKVHETILAGPSRTHSFDSPLPMALAWSFPIEQTSLGSGKLQKMGKAFKAADTLEGCDLGEVIELACRQRGLYVKLQAILNDSSACLLSQAYSQPSTRLSLILGTGFNVAAHLPVSAIGRAKFGIRPDGWFDEASHVIVNTELSMFGRGLLPLTRWDHQLLDDHPRPDFQPMEYLASGMYLGEVARFALIDAIESTGIFNGIIPSSLNTPYALSTETLSQIQADTTADLLPSVKLFEERHPSSNVPTFADISALRSLASFISARSSALMATCVYSLWEFRLESQQEYVSSLPEASPLRNKAAAELNLEKTVVSFNGSVIENYPGYQQKCQAILDSLVKSQDSKQRGTIELMAAKESSLMGAAVASACVDYQS